jgi:hypothetical protein
LKGKNIRCGNWVLNGHVKNPTTSITHSFAIEPKLVLSPTKELPRVTTRESTIFVGGFMNPNENAINGSSAAPKISCQYFQKTIGDLTLLVVICWMDKQYQTPSEN